MKEWIPPFLKQLELLTWCIGYLWLGSKEKFNISKLFISYTHNTHFAKFGQNSFYSFPMNFGTAKGTKSDVPYRSRMKSTICL